MDFYPRNFDTCKFRSDASLQINQSTCCGEQVIVSYRCKLLKLDNVDQMICGVCQSYEKE